MSRRRVLIGAAIVAILVVALVLWRKQSSSSKSASPGSQETAHVGRTGGIAQGIAKTKRHIAGTVFLDEAPAPAAIVRLIESDGAPAATVQADAAGRFDLGDVIADRYEVIAEVAHATGATVFIDLRDPAMQPAPDQLRLVAHPCDGFLYGVVRDASGGTIAKARVTDSERFVTGPGVDSRDDGSYELCVAVGDNVVTASADGYATAFSPMAVFGKVHRDFELIPEAVVAGRAVRADDGSPVEGARVMLTTSQPAMNRLPYALATSDTDGRFRFHGIAAGSYEIRATAPHLATAEAVEVTADVDAPVEDIQCPLVAALSVSGRIVDKQKKPVVGERIGIRGVGRGGSWDLSGYRDAPTQTDGSFFIDSLVPGEYVIGLSHASLSKPSSTLKLDKTDIEGLILEVDTLGSIAGRVTRAGKPVEGATISARPTERQTDFNPQNYQGGGDTTTSDPDGRFTFSGLPAGTYILYAESKRVGAFTPGPQVTLAANETKTGVEVEMGLAGSIAGTVVDQSNVPVGGVHLRFSLLHGADFGEATTDEDGKFKATALSGGGDYIYELRSGTSTDLAFRSADGKRFTPIAVKDGDTQVTGVVIKIRYDRLTISGRVLNSAGAPVPDISVTVKQNDADPMRGWWSGPSATTDTSGAFTIRDLPAGTYALSARGPTSSKRVSNIAAGAKGVEIRLPATGSLEGTLAGFTKPPRVTAMGGEDYDMMSGPSRAVVTANHFTFKSLPTGKYYIRAQSDDGYASGEATVTAGAKATITLENKGLGTVEGHVIDDKNAPVEDLRCMVMGAASPATTDAAGTFRVERAPVGAQHVGCYGGAGMATGSVTVVANTTAHVELVAKPRGAGGYGARGFAGLELEGQLSEVIVKTIIAGGPAEKAGMKVGDSLTKVDGEAVDGRFGTNRTLMQIEMHPVGTVVKLTIERDDKEQVIEVKLEQPRDGAAK